MKVLHIEAGRYLYGGAVQVMMLLHGLRRQYPDDRQLLACSADSALAELARHEALAERVYPLKMGGDADIGQVSRLAQLIARERPDLVHVHSRRGADLWGALACRRAGVPAVLSRRVDNPDRPRWLARWKYRRYRRVIAISEHIRQLLIEREGLAPQHVSCVRSAVDSGRFCPDPQARTRLRQAFGLAADDRPVGMIAQFIERKGHRTALAALPAVLRAEPRARLLLFGRGPLRPAIERLCREQGLGERVVFAGLRDDLAALLPGLELVVHPVTMEGLGVALLEAAACGLPLVGSRAGGVPEIIRDGINGTLIPPANPEALAAAVIELLSDSTRARAYGTAGRRLIVDEFSPAAMVAGNRAVYQKLLGG